MILTKLRKKKVKERIEKRKINFEKKRKKNKNTIKKQRRKCGVD